MPIYALGDVEPDLHLDAYVHPDAVVIGNEAGAVVGAGAVDAYNTHIPARRMVLGVPARIREGYEVPEGAWSTGVDRYVEGAKRYRTELRRLADR